METDNVILTQLMKDDIPVLNTLRNDWENKRMTLGVRFPIIMESDQNWYENIVKDHTNKNIYFAIKSRNSALTVGIIQLTAIDWINRNAHVGIQIINEENGKGFGSDAINLIVDYAFNTLNIRKIQAEVVSYNIPSLHLFEKCGFEIEGKLIQQIYFNSYYHDLYVLGKINRESSSF